MRIRSWLLAPLGAYAALACLLAGPLWTHPGQLVVADNPHDAAAVSWNLTWVPWALEHGHNPLHTTAINHPDGVNLMWNTWIPVLGLLTWPLTAAFGAIWTVAFLITLGPIASALSMLGCLRTLGVRRTAATIAGAFYGFSPAMTAKSLAHVTHLWQVLLPVLVLLGYKLVTAQERRPRLAAGLGSLAALQVLFNEELLLYTGLALALILLMMAASLRPALASLAVPAINYLLALGVFGVLAGPFLLYQLTGPDAGSGAIFSTEYFKVDLQSYVTPSRLQLLATSGAEHRAEGFTGGYSEKTAYLGWPLVLLAVFVLVVRWRDLRVRCLLVPAFVLAFLALGPSLVVGGDEKGITLPWHWVQSLPSLENALSTRLPLLTALLLAGVIGFVLDDALARGGRVAVAALTGAAVALVPLLPAPLRTERVAPTPQLFVDHDSPVLDRRGSVLVLPFPTGTFTDPMRWQATADMSFSMPGGYFIGPADDGHLYIGGQPRPVQQVLGEIATKGVAPVVDEGLRERTLADFRGWDVHTIVLAPDSHEAAYEELITAVVGTTPSVEGGVKVWLLD